MNYRLRSIDTIPALQILAEAGIEGADRLGDDDAAVFGDVYFAALGKAEPGSIVFARSGGKSTVEDVAAQIESCRASLILADPVFKKSLSAQPGRLIIFIDYPRLAFIKLFRHCLIEYEPEFMKPGDFHASCRVGPGVNVELGARIGERVHLFGNNYIAACARIGDDVEILPGAVIGGEGFGYVRDTDGSLTNFPHLGGVVIEDKVTVGSGSCIDRGNFGDTIIRRGSKLDNLVYIAHNADIGEHSIICAQASIAGATKIGSYCRIAPSATIRDGVKIGDKTIIGMGACVVDDIPGGKVAFGVPARVKVDKGDRG